jgi:hypothetical protein
MPAYYKLHALLCIITIIAIQLTNGSVNIYIKKEEMNRTLGKFVLVLINNNNTYSSQALRHDYTTLWMDARMPTQ